MPQTAQTEQELPLQDYANQTTVAANTMDILDAAFAGMSVISRTTTTPPAVVNGARYIVGTGATGDWSGYDDYIAYGQNAAFVYLAPKEGWTTRIDGTSEIWRYDGSAWVEASMEHGTVATGLTASTTQTQGQQPLTSSMNRITVCANTNDTVTLPSARTGLQILVANDGANTMQVFPASGDYIDNAAINASITMATTTRKLFFALSAAKWVSI